MYLTMGRLSLTSLGAARPRRAVRLTDRHTVGIAWNRVLEPPLSVDAALRVVDVASALTTVVGVVEIQLLRAAFSSAPFCLQKRSYPTVRRRSQLFDSILL